MRASALATLTLFLASTQIAIASEKLMTGCPGAGDGQRRVALLIGNSKYQSASLPQPEKDVDSVANALCKDGFAWIDVVHDAQTKSEVLRELGELSVASKSNTKVSLFYYSGHGIQIHGNNYVLPTAASFESDATVLRDGVSVDDDVIPDLGKPDSDRLRVVILDACRNNPFADSGLNSVDLTKDNSAPTNLLVAFAGASGHTIDGMIDGTSPYTWTFVSQLTSARLDVLKVHDVAKRGVYEWTLKVRGPAKTQNPELNDNVDHGTYYYSGSGSANGSAPDVDQIVDTVVEQAIAKVWADTPSKSVVPSLEIESLPVDVLMTDARKALDTVVVDSHGAPRVDSHGFALYAPDFGRAAVFWQAAAAKGSMSAFRRLGDLLVTGHGVALNREKAFEYYLRAAAGGDAVALERLGTAYRDGLGVRQDARKAMDYFERSSRAGAAIADDDLAYAYLWGMEDSHGKVIQKDYSRALSLFRKADAEGVADATAWIGWTYMIGRGVERDKTKALATYRRAADLGDVQAIETMSNIYEVGFGVPKDKKMARLLFNKALALADVWFIKNYELAAK